jgi:uncharacterized protein (TIGR02217 family)
MVYPLYVYNLSYEFLRDDATHNDLKTLMGFYLSRQGAFDSFLYDDTSDDSIVGQAIGTGNGSQTAFQLVRTYGGFTEPCRDIMASPAPAIYLAGTLQGSGYTIGYANSGILTFTTAPGNGVAVTANFSYYHRVRFVEYGEGDDGFSNFMSSLWDLKKVSFVSAR